jgi:starch-binding outer membrane protein, SusD/RagB family
VKDFTEAETLLPPLQTGARLGRATSGAAKAFLAKVYLTRKQWQLARDKAKEIIDTRATFGYNLWAKYADVFDIANENRTESIFESQHNGGINGTGSGLPTYFSIINSSDQGRGFGSFYANNNLVNSFEDADQRKNLFSKTAVTSSGAPIISNLSHFYKYRDVAATTFPECRNNFPIMRYADVLLMYAEASNEVSGPSADAIETVNQIRRRAYGFPIQTPNTTSDLPALSQNDLRDAIYKERRLEFYAEGQRWLDLVRTGRLVRTIRALPDDATTLNSNARANVQEKHNLFPIPQRERDANPSLTQNAGY